MIWVTTPSVAGAGAKKGLALLAAEVALSSPAASATASAVAAALAWPASFDVKADASDSWNGSSSEAAVSCPADFQVLIKFNLYMYQLMEHEKRSIDAERDNQEPPPAPPIPDFKPTFSHGLTLACRELAVGAVRGMYVIGAHFKLGPKRAMVLTRDYRSHIRDVLVFKHRLDPCARQFKAYTSSVVHATALYFFADATVSVILHAYHTVCRKDISTGTKVTLVARGSLAQLVRTFARMTMASVGAAVGSLLWPRHGSFLGFMVSDMVILYAISPVTAFIAGDYTPTCQPPGDHDGNVHDMMQFAQ